MQTRVYPYTAASTSYFTRNDRDKFFESSEFIQWARELVKENEVSRLQIRRQGCEHEEG